MNTSGYETACTEERLVVHVKFPNRISGALSSEREHCH